MSQRTEQVSRQWLDNDLRLAEFLETLPEFRYAKHDPDNYKSRALEIATRLQKDVIENANTDDVEIQEIAQAIQYAYNEGWSAGVNFAGAGI